jgi:hypothetical protein
MAMRDDPPLVLSKFDVAERQLLQAIRLFFKEEDEVSIHTLSEAAAQVLYDIRDEYDIQSIFRDSDHIRPERRTEWLAIVFKSRNFFKHADRDKGKVHEFKSIFNDMSILDAVNMYQKVKKRWTPETILFFVWLGLQYPDLLLEDSELKTALDSLAAKDYAPNHYNKAFFAWAIDMLRSGDLTMPNVVTYMGVCEI